jgi:hypothetical protein
MWIATAALVGLSVLILMLPDATPDRAAVPAPEHDAMEADTVCRQFVSKRLLAPASAEFASGSDRTVTHQGDGRYRVVAYVDSQNRFGAMLRMPYTCDVTWQSGDMWTLNALDIQQP